MASLNSGIAMHRAPDDRPKVGCSLVAVSTGEFHDWSLRFPGGDQGRGAQSFAPLGVPHTQTHTNRRSRYMYSLVIQIATINITTGYLYTYIYPSSPTPLFNKVVPKTNISQKPTVVGYKML